MRPNFQERIEQYQVQISALEKQLTNVSLYRLIIFVGSLILIFILANKRETALVALALMVSIVLFAFILSCYIRLTKEKIRLANLKQINEQEILIDKRQLNGLDSGEEFMVKDHSYAIDLDIFGQHSLFQILNRTTTESGKNQLASWLLNPAKPDLVRDRQKAIMELAGKLAWRQEFQAAGMPFVNPKSSYQRLLKWTEAPVALFPKRRQYLALAVVLGLAATSAAIVGIGHIILCLFSISAFSFQYLLPLVGCILINRYVIKKIRPVTEPMINDLQGNVAIFAASESLIAMIESTSFESELLKAWQDVFSGTHYSAVREIKRLRKLLEAFQQRGSRQMIGNNAFYGIFNLIWLLDIYFVLAAEKWKGLNAGRLREWGVKIGEFEAINSLAGFTYANPEFAFPVILDNSYKIHFKDIVHPLLSSEQRVGNDFDLTERGSVIVITGSNMAGKSTFLRTIGCNLVLSMTGAPCCAFSGRVSPMALFTSMRTQDNLEEGISSFYAELRRIEMLLKLISSGEPVFFLLDEMFKGTNSDDRYKGGVSLIRQLSELNAFGIISTHDLELAKVASQHLPVRNYSFNSELRKDQIIFNYKLTEGFCTDFNASALMKRSGIQILSEI